MEALLYAPEHRAQPPPQQNKALSPAPMDYRLQFLRFSSRDLDRLLATFSSVLEVVLQFGVLLEQILEQAKGSPVSGVGLSGGDERPGGSPVIALAGEG